MPRKRPPPPPSPPHPSLPAPSALAAKNNLSASSEAEIRTAFSIFSTTTTNTATSSSSPSHDANPSDIHASATIPTSALMRALAALDCGPRSAAEKRQLTESVDPTDVGEVRYEDFVALAALQLRRRTRGRGRGGARNNEVDGGTEGIPDEVEAAFRLFLEAGGHESQGNRKEGDERITIRGLRRVAKELGTEGGGGGMGEDVLRDMIMEANGLGPEGVGKGVGRREFADVMKRAGVF